MMKLPITTIYGQIREERNNFYNNSITVVSGYTHNQYEIIKRCHLYLSSKFEGSSLYLNRAKLFFNVTVPACEVGTKMLKVLTREIKLISDEAKNVFATLLLEKELKQWLKTSKFANILKKIADELPRYGSVVIEKTKDGCAIVDLRRLILDPSVERILDSRFVTIVYYMTETELKKTTWDNVDVAIERFGDTRGASSYEDQEDSMTQVDSTPLVKVYKRYGEVPKWWIDGGKSSELVKALFIVAGVDAVITNENGSAVGDGGIILFKSRWYKQYPFQDFHYNKIKGRWLGYGITESLFDTQVRLNELKNQKRISMEISTIHLFQTKDKQIVRSILTDLESGDVLLSPSGIEPIANEERNLSAFDSEEASYIQQAQRLSFAYDAVSGETLAASTTATAVINAQQQATSTFGFKRDTFTDALRDFFNELVMPELYSDLTAEHIMRFSGTTQEIQKLDEAASELHANDFIKDRVLNGETVTQEEIDMEKQRAIDEYRKLAGNRYLLIKDKFYDDVGFEFDFNTGNEQINPQQIATNAQALLAVYNPQAMQDPIYKLVYFKYAESLGISQGEIEIASAQSAQIAQENPQSLGLPPPVGVPGAPIAQTA